MASAASDGELQQLAFDFSRQALERQDRALDELRSRAGTLLAASLVAASFLGAQAAEEGGKVLTVVGLLAFVLSIVASASVLLPKPGLIFALRGSVLFEEELDEPGGAVETHRKLAYWLEKYRDDNQLIIDRLFARYQWAVIFVVGEVLLWVVNLFV